LRKLSEGVSQNPDSRLQLWLDFHQGNDPNTGL
jgi:hypothetical protein